MLIPAIVFAAAYLLGSLSAAIVVGRALGLGDPREFGSGNPGATNVLRAFGRKAAALTLAGDLLKGLLPVLLVRMFGGDALLATLAGAGAFLGHLFPVYFGFRGGKGVATYIGVLLGLHWHLGAAFALVWLTVAAITRYSSLAALVAALASPAIALVLGLSPAAVAVLALMVALLYWRHEGNIRKLLKGSESRIGAGR